MVLGFRDMAMFSRSKHEETIGNHFQETTQGLRKNARTDPRRFTGRKDPSPIHRRQGGSGLPKSLRSLQTSPDVGAFTPKAHEERSKSP